MRLDLSHAARRPAFAAVALLVPLLLLHCGSDDSAGSPEDASLPQPDRGPDAPTGPGSDASLDAGRDASDANVVVDAGFEGGYGACDDAGWCPVISAGISIRGGFSAGMNDSWVTMDHGKIAHYNGSTWSYDQLATYAVETGAAAIWGSSGTSVWAALNGSGPTAQRLFHWNGTAWSAIALTLADGVQLASLWGRDATRVWVITSAGTILSCSATACTTATTTAFQLISVHSSGASDAWVGGVDPGVSPNVAVSLHFDGTSWSRKSLPPDWDGNIEYVGVQDVFTRGPTDAWTISQSGNHLDHWNGTAWSAVTSFPTMTPNGSATQLTRIVGTDATHLVFGTAFADILAYDGSKWTFETKLGAYPGLSITGEWITAGSYAWAVAGSSIASTVFRRPLH